MERLYLEHYGVKGMKWGVHRGSNSVHNNTERYKNRATMSQKEREKLMNDLGLDRAYHTDKIFKYADTYGQKTRTDTYLELATTVAGSFVGTAIGSLGGTTGVVIGGMIGRTVGKDAYSLGKERVHDYRMDVLQRRVSDITEQYNTLKNESSFSKDFLRKIAKSEKQYMEQLSK